MSGLTRLVFLDSISKYHQHIIRLIYTHSVLQHKSWSKCSWRKALSAVLDSRWSNDKEVATQCLNQ